MDTELLASIAKRMMTSNKVVDVNGKSVPVSRTSKNRLRTLAFTMDGASIRPSSRMLRSLAAGGNWHVRGIRSCNARTRERTGWWRFVSMWT
jgi:hypothetical protein